MFKLAATQRHTSRHLISLSTFSNRRLPRLLHTTSILASQQPQQQVQLHQQQQQNEAVTTAPPPPSPKHNAFQDLLGLTSPSPDLKNTFYQRQLPTTLVRFSSQDGKKLFRSAMEAGHAEGFFSLTGNFTTQSEPAYCGPSSLAMVLNALEVDPKRRWKGNWRWYSDMKKNGITFDKFACLAKCHSDVVVKRGNDFTLEEFKKDVENVTTRSDEFIVISFSRKTLGQTGDGHFSPIGAYNPETQMVLVLDTARYKYPSYWCPIETLYESMKPIDKETGRPRGYFLLSYDADHPPISLCGVQQKRPKNNNNTATIENNHSSSSSPSSLSSSQHPLAQQGVAPVALNWSTLAKSFCKRIPENMWIEKPRTLEHVVQLVLRNVPPEYTVILANQSFRQSPNEYIDKLLQDTAQSALYPIVLDALYSPDNKNNGRLDVVDHHAAFATLFVLGSPRMLYTSLPRDLQETLDRYRKDEYMSDVVKREVDRISVEVTELTKTFCTCGPGWTDPLKEC
ncbi:Phytochelatin synthase-domain-containing protein [Zychaea mexicana]|uniref:Phytochelatin synthase-domain-containing protein n=1 Tax=Zychaea mexicana TaxID=64656 RepID=UPI0022FF19C4|nr:Phytochelatin synthase-domain-containing protein [Zychaea mexicana]KAI9497108.1 Phytochelatin synthase-domain-containing protein [Zychaea mexicana]